MEHITKCMRRVLQALHSGCTPKLKRFTGRPQDYSPKARLLNLLGYKLPFDRHDWIVDRCGREVSLALAILGFVHYTLTYFLGFMTRPP